MLAINNVASTLGGDLTPFFIDRSAHLRLLLLPPRDDPAAGESHAHYAAYAQRMRAIEATVLELLAAEQAERKVTIDTGRVDTAFKLGDRVLLHQGAALRSRHLQAVPAVG